MFKLLIPAIISVIIFTGCEGSGSSDISGAETANNTDTPSPGYIKEDLGNGLEKAYLKGAGGEIAEEGYMLNGKKHGAWVSYSGDGRPETVVSYIDGNIYGPDIVIDHRMQVERFTQKTNNQKNGMDGTYKNGRPVEVLRFSDGELHGTQRFYFTSGREVGKLQRDIAYKHGTIDGLMRYYDPDGRVTLKYTYENGERVGGGIVE